MQHIDIPLDAIDFQDATFQINPFGELERLVKSIERIGLINPPILRSSPNKYQIVSGHKRLKALNRIGKNTVMARVYEPQELNDFEAFIVVYEENRDRFCEMQKAILISRLLDATTLSDNQFIATALPIMEIAPSRKQFDRFVGLSRLPLPMIEACLKKQISIEQAYIFSSIDGETALNIFNKLFLKYKFNTNETRELVKELPEAAAIKGLSIDGILHTISTKIADANNKNEFRKILKRLRYPDLTSMESAYRDYCKGMGLPKKLDVSHSPYFEKNYLNFSFKIEDEKSYQEIIDVLGGLNSKGSIKILLNLVRSGDTPK